MKELYEQMKEKLSLMETVYNIVRIVDPISKQSIIIKDKEIKNIDGSCYDYWKKGETCSNCISARTYIEKDTFVKIEYVDDKVILVTSIPVFIERGMYVIEMLKDISQNGIICDINDRVNEEVNEMCVSSDEMVEDKQKLIVSQYLDELIVEYMKKTINLNPN